ncbi:MAG: hypothetical protein QM500_14690 [Methylococcales bacterium]
MFKFYIKYLIFILLAFPPGLFATSFDYNVGVSAAHYDNVNLEHEPISDETSGSVYTGLTIFEDNASFYTSLDANISTTNYHDDVALDENVAELYANIIWRIKPGQFEWYLDNTFTQTAIDTFESNAPSNKQNINVFSTGPNYIIRMNAKNNLQFEARVENYNYEENLDNNRAFLAGRWFHNVNSSLTVTVNDEAESIRFDDDINIDLDRNDIFLSVDYLRGVNTFNAEYGYTHISNKNIQDIDEDRYLLSFSNARTRTSSIRVTYENILSDTGSEIAGTNLNESIDESLNNTAANDVFVDETFSFQLFNTLSNGKFTFEVNATDREYRRQTELDEINKVAIIKGFFNLSRANHLAYNLTYITTDFQDPSFEREDEDYIYSLIYSHKVRRNINISLEVTSAERISTLAEKSYDDLRFIMSLNYTSSQGY